MEFAGLSVWGDSIAKGVVFDEARGRYTICRDNCLMKLSKCAPFPVSNYSVMGQTSENGLERMQGSALTAGNIAAIEYGGNDCDLDWKQVSEHPEALQFGRVPLEKFAQNLRELIRRAQAGSMKPVLVTPPPLIAKRYFDWVSRGLSRDNILKYLGDVEHIYRWQDSYAQCVRALADELDIEMVDIRAAMESAGDLGELMCVDGIHPNAAGHALIYDTVAPLLK